MYRIVFLASLTLISLFNACKPNPVKPEEKPIALFQQQTVTESNCKTDSTACAEFQANFVHFTGSDQLARTLNAVTDSFATALVSMEQDSQVFSPAAAAQHLLRLHEQAKKEETVGIMGWSVHLDSNVPYVSENYLTLDLMADSYLGGAHPNTFRQIQTYDRTTALPVNYAALVTDTTKLSALLELKYKAEKGATPQSDLKELTFDGSPLPLPAFIAQVEQGLLFYYNDYEVAPHAVGPTEIVLTWAELKGMVKEPGKK